MSKLYTIFDKELNQRMFYLMQDYQRVVVTSITISANKTTAEYGESVTFTAHVKDKDNNPVSGSTVSFYNINSRLGAAISDGDGVATFTYTVQHDLSVNARADNVQSNSVAVTMVEYDLALSSNTPIIQSSNNAVVTALLTRNGSAYGSQTLSYTIKHGSTTIDSGTATTNNSGQATITYTGTGAGDVQVEVSYSTLLQETYELQDCNYYDVASQSNLVNYTASDNDDVMVYDSNYEAYRITRTRDGETIHIINNVSIPNTQKISYDIMTPNISSVNNQPRILFSNENNQNNLGVRIVMMSSMKSLEWFGTNQDITGVNVSFSANIWYHIEIILDGNTNTVNCYNQNNELIGTKTIINSELDSNANNISINSCYNNNAIFYIKNIKVKAL